MSENSAENLIYNFTPRPDDYLVVEKWFRIAQSQSPLNFQETPPDDELVERFGIANCQRYGFLPWRKLGNSIVIVGDERAREYIDDVTKSFNERIYFIPASDEQIESMDFYINKYLIDFAHNICPEKYSLKNLRWLDNWFAHSVMMGLIIAGFMISPLNAGAIILCIMGFLVLGNSFFRLMGLFYLLKKTEPVSHYKHIPLNRYNTPKVSLLIPLYREPQVVARLVENLNKLKYPREKLEIKLILEHDDHETQSILQDIDLPSEYEVIIAPSDWLKTKPKAMNYALPFCDGEIIGIYDAEDAPAYNQLRYVVAEFLADKEKKIGAVQCELEFFNATQNWLSRCFTIEYRVWFASVLPAMKKLKMPVPLGGTSVFFRKSLLMDQAAWDPYNVTEDAELGVRLTRMEYEIKILEVPTYEEANTRPISWVRQRSRWLKGYVMSYISHIRRPLKLLGDLGFFGFLGVHILFLGAIGNYLLLPVFWLFWVSAFANGSVIPLLTSNYAFPIFSTLMLSAQLVNMTNMYFSLGEKRLRKLRPWILTLFAYWPLGVLAAYKAAFELIFIPFYWDKTDHGYAKHHEHKDDEKE